MATLVGYLEAGELQEVWRAIKGWYANTTARPPKPCYKTMAKQTAEREELYRTVHPPGEPILCNVETTYVNDAAPGDAELWEVVAGMCNGRAGGATGMKAEYLKGWLQGAITEEKEGGREGAGTLWRAFIDLVQTVWETGSIPQQMLWMVVVLIPKGKGNYRGIGLLDQIWKGIEVVMDNRLKCLELHDCLHGFLAGRGTGTAIMEVKLVQQLA